MIQLKHRPKSSIEFYQITYTDGKYAYESMLKITCIKELKIKTTVRYHYILIRIVKMQKHDDNNFGNDTDKLLLIAGRNAKWYRLFARQFHSF